MRSRLAPLADSRFRLLFLATFGSGIGNWLALVVPIPGRLLQSEQHIGRGHWRDLHEGFVLVRHSRALMSVLVAWSIVMLANAHVNVAEIFLAKETFHSGDFGFGLLWAGTGVGMIAGGLVASHLIETRGIHRVYTGILAVFAAGILLAGVSPDVWVATLGMVVSGFGNGAAIVANITLVQRGAPDRLRGPAFTLLMSATYTV